MSKEMINTNKAILVHFPAYTSQSQLNNTSTAHIYIPFPVKQINVKGIDLDFDADFRVMYFTSNLVDNGPLGSGFGGIFSISLHQLKTLVIFLISRGILMVHTPLIIMS